MGSRPLTASLIQQKNPTTMCHAMGISNLVTPVVLRRMAKLLQPDCLFLNLVVTKRRCIPWPEPRLANSLPHKSLFVLVLFPELLELQLLR